MIDTDRDEEKEQRNGVQVLARAATILRLLAADSSGGLTFSELVARSGLPRTTVHRIRGALEHEDFIYTDAATGRLHLGPGIMRLAMAKRGPADRGAGRTSSSSRASSTRPSTSACWTACTCCSSPSIPAPQRSLMVVSQRRRPVPGVLHRQRQGAAGAAAARRDQAAAAQAAGDAGQAHAGQPQGPAAPSWRGPRAPASATTARSITPASAASAWRSPTSTAARRRSPCPCRRRASTRTRTAVSAALLRVRDEIQVALHNG